MATTGPKNKKPSGHREHPERPTSSRAPTRSALKPSTPAQTPPLESSPFWLLKSEPETYSIDQLKKDKRTHWNDVRNFQARNYLKRMKQGDIALIYHSGDDKSVVGIAQVVKTAYPDPEPTDPNTEWVQVDIEFVETLKRPVALSTLKATEELAQLMLIRQSRLSVMPVEEAHYKKIRQLGGL
jgi:predicted RNA-binding protein with PUA-like domain